MFIKSTQQVQPDWLVVVGHYPVYSSGEHMDMDELIENLVPLMKKYGVDAYFCGHDHISEHLRSTFKYY